MSEAVRHPPAADLVQPSTDVLRVVFDLAVPIAAADDATLEPLLLQSLKTLASRFGAKQAALVTITVPHSINCELEFAESESTSLSLALGCLTEQARHALVLDLLDSESDSVRVLTYDGLDADIRPLNGLAGVGIISRHGDQRVALLLGHPSVPFPYCEHVQQYLCVLFPLLSATMERLRTARTSSASLRQSHKLGLAARAMVSLAHDFNNTLYAIGCVSDVVVMNLEESSPIRKNHEDIKRMIARGATLTRRLVAFGRQNSAKIEMADLREVLTSFGPVLQSILGPQVKLQLEMTAEPMHTRTDRSLVEQLLLEAVLTAQTSAPAQGVLCVTLGPDTEAHMPAAGGLNAAPTRAFRLTIRCNHAGTCLNLGGSQEFSDLAQALTQGGVSVRSCDSQIELAFVEAAHPTESKNLTFNAQKPSASQSTILLVDDEEISRRAAAHILRREGHRVLEADGYRSATKILENREQPISALITDVILPDGDGVELCRQLRVTSPRTKTIFISGYGPQILETRGGTTLGHAFLQKPCRSGELLQLLQQVLS